MQLIFQAYNILEAHIVAGLLTSENIDCHVGGHYLQGAVGDLPATDFAHVYLHHDSDREAALALIQHYESGRL